MLDGMRDNVATREMELVYSALADRTRIRLLHLIRDGEMAVLPLAEKLGLSQPKVSRHLAYLRRAGLVTARRDGRTVYYSISQDKGRSVRAVIRTALDWVDNTGPNIVHTASGYSEHQIENIDVEKPDPRIEVEETFPYDEDHVRVDIFPNDVQEDDIDDAGHNDIEDFLL